jgi:hypothetical protein
MTAGVDGHHLTRRRHGWHRVVVGDEPHGPPRPSTAQCGSERGVHARDASLHVETEVLERARQERRALGLRVRELGMGVDEGHHVTHERRTGRDGCPDGGVVR